MLVSQDSDCLCVCIYRVQASSCQLLGSWETDVLSETGLHLHVTADAAELCLWQERPNKGPIVLICSSTGIIASHRVRKSYSSSFSWHYAPGLGLLGLSYCRLLVFTIAGVRVVEVGHVPRLPSDELNAVEQCSAIGSWGSLAVVWRLNKWRPGQQELLFVELAQAQDIVLQRLKNLDQPLGINGSDLQVAVGCCSVALAEKRCQQVSVRASAGPQAGSELFRLQAACPIFDALCGLFLAVAKHTGGLCVLHGVTGTQLASWQPSGPKASGLIHSLGWLHDASGVWSTEHIAGTEHVGGTVLWRTVGVVKF